MLINALGSLTISVYHAFPFPSEKSYFSQLSAHVLPLVLLSLMVQLSSVNTHFTLYSCSHFPDLSSHRRYFVHQLFLLESLTTAVVDGAIPFT